MCDTYIYFWWMRYHFIENRQNSRPLPKYEFVLWLIQFFFFWRIHYYFIENRLNSLFSAIVFQNISFPHGFFLSTRFFFMNYSAENRQNSCLTVGIWTFILAETFKFEIFFTLCYYFIENWENAHYFAQILCYSTDFWQNSLLIVKIWTFLRVYTFINALFIYLFFAQIICYLYLNEQAEFT